MRPTAVGRASRTGRRIIGDMRIPGSLLLAAVATGTIAAAQENPVAETARPPAAATADDATAARHARFAALMKDVTLVGSFTRDDDEKATARREEYAISGATKIGAGDGWLVMARIRYGTIDVTVPVPVEVKWAGETPVITLDDVTIPGLGTFSSRVVLDRDRYAGTWTHDKVGGHMFGKIMPTVPLPPANPSATTPEPGSPPAESK